MRTIAHKSITFVGVKTGAHSGAHPTQTHIGSRTTATTTTGRAATGRTFFTRVSVLRDFCIGSVRIKLHIGFGMDAALRRRDIGATGKHTGRRGKPK